jgi:regulation of enolase protein 1 (concanavalin A-like superfamily)
MLLACALMTVAHEAQAQTGLPAGWQARDVGGPALAGSTAVSSGTWTISGGGTNVWSTADQFQFAYTQITGDIDISVRIAAFTVANDWSKAGVMIRESLNADAKNAFMLNSRGTGPAFQRRTSTGGSTVRTTGSGTVPGWVRLVRKGSLFTAYSSTNGTSWTTVATATVNMTASVFAGLVVSSRDANKSATATFTNLAVSSTTAPVTTLPAPWADGDIGSPALSGSASSPSSGSFSVTGAGADIWFSADQFHFLYQPVQGDTQIVARVANVQATDAWSKGGVMIRQSLAAGSQHASMFGTSSNGWVFQFRPVANGNMVHTQGPSGAAPGWVKLTRAGDLFSAYASSDGVTWTLVDTETIAMSGTVYVGLAVTSHNVNARATDSFTNVAVTTAAGNQLPSVSITSPTSGATFTAPANISINATASDTDGTIAQVDFYRGSTLIGSDTTSPYSATWSSAPAGSYQLTAVARDNTGATTTSTAVGVTVTSTANQPPTAAITSPASGASFTAPANIMINASASDSDGTVTRVDFYRGSTLIGSDATSPYSVTWSNVAAGSYTLTAVAVDNANATTTSAGVNITVTTAANQLPTVSITSPTSGATYTAPASITINASASDSDGTVSSVDFYQGSTLIATDTTNPYSASWTNVAAGTYSLTAVARDNGGATKTSTAVSVTVNGSAQPTTLIFTASADHATLVTSYVVAVYRAADDPATASPVATRDIGKPAPASNGEITVDISSLIDPLAAGSYKIVVRAVGSGGTTASAPSATFTK